MTNSNYSHPSLCQHTKCMRKIFWGIVGTIIPHRKNIYLPYIFHSVQNSGMTYSIAENQEYLSFTEPTHTVKRSHRILLTTSSAFQKEPFHLNSRLTWMLRKEPTPGPKLFVCLFCLSWSVKTDWSFQRC